MKFDFTLNTEVVDAQLEKMESKLILDGDFSKLYASDIEGNIAGYNGLQMHLHSPSEHKIEGKLFDAELQLIHEMRDEFFTD